MRKKTSSKNKKIKRLKNSKNKNKRNKKSRDKRRKRPPRIKKKAKLALPRKGLREAIKCLVKIQSKPHYNQVKLMKFQKT